MKNTEKNRKKFFYFMRRNSEKIDVKYLSKEISAVTGNETFYLKMYCIPHLIVKKTYFKH